MKKKIEVAILSDVDRDIIYAELSSDKEQFAEVTQDEDGSLSIAIHPAQSGEPQRFDLNELEKALAETRTRFQKLDQPQ